MSKALLLDPNDGDLIMIGFWISTSTFESQKVDQSQKRFPMTPSRVQRIATLQQTHPTLLLVTASLSDRALDFRGASSDWSIREILAHLVDDEMYVMRTRLERIIKEDRPLLAPHDEKQWYANRNTTRDHVSDLLSDFALQRAASLGIIILLRESDWVREGHQPEYGVFTAEEWLTHWVAHDTVHLRQIERTIEVYQTQFVVNARRSEQVWPSNASTCPQS